MLLVEGNDLVVISKRESICNSPNPLYGSKPVDDGNFFYTDDEKREFILIEPNAEKYFKPFLSAKEYLNSEKRWCLWLKDISPSDFKNIPNVIHRVEKVKEFRLKSTKQSTRELANYSTLFAEIRQPINNYILIPLHTSENRKYIPFGFFTPDSIVGNSCMALQNASLVHLGVLSSAMHMAWIKTVCGRLESRIRYSNDIVYNNYPWPENPSEKQKETIGKAAQKVLDARAAFPNSSLADLYNPLTMPPVLVKAHNELDKAVDLAYRPQPFINETKRIEFLFELYDKYTAGLFVVEKKKKKIPK